MSPIVYFCRMKMQITAIKVSLILFCFTLCGLSTKAQYYYNDLMGTEANKKNFSLLQKEKIKKITVKAYDAEGEEIDDFVLYQEVNPKKRTLTTFSKTNLTDASILETTYAFTGLPETALDSSECASTRTFYQYDSNGRLTYMFSRAIQSEQSENIVSEERIYTYNQNNTLSTMIRIKGNSDTMLVTLIPDEHGLPAEEHWKKDGKKIETWYYYYDAQNRLTDIVRYNDAAKKLLPDYLFSYDEPGNLTTKVTVIPGTGAFRIWQYRYDERGLKIQESVMNKQRKSEGKLVYTYDHF